MRKILITLAVLVILLIGGGLFWIFAGRQISLFVDRFGSIEVRSEQIHFIRYEGNGTGGILHVNQVDLSLNDVVPPLQPPSVGSTKDEQLGLAAGGKVFPFGPLPKTSDEVSESFATSPPGRRRGLDQGPSQRAGLADTSGL